MGEIALRIHSEGNEPQEIGATPDTTANELIFELINGLKLPKKESDGRPIPWQLLNKEAGRPLGADTTLMEENLRNGQDLYLRRAEIRSVVTSEPPPPPKSYLRWALLVLAVVVSATSGYMWGYRTVAVLSVELQTDRGRLASLNRDLATAKRDLAEAQDKVDKVSAESGEKQGSFESQVTELTARNASLLRQLAGKKEELKRTIDSDQAQIASVRTNLATVQGQVRNTATDLQTRQQELASLRQENTRLQQEKSQSAQELQQLKMAANSKPKTGSISWTGPVPKGTIIQINQNGASLGQVSGSLPGAPCTIVPSDPAHVKLQTSETDCALLKFTIAGLKGTQTIRFTWQSR